MVERLVNIVIDVFIWLVMSMVDYKSGRMTTLLGKTIN